MYPACLPSVDCARVGEAAPAIYEDAGVSCLRPLPCRLPSFYPPSPPPGPDDNETSTLVQSCSEPQPRPARTTSKQTNSRS